ncbi:DUF7118 family protein [Salinirussus salinus]|jgi:hypothetical protein|uniref:DUF7118 family protein n=1 Tax=Salinirussus salinus TaxID=1198300 RepID=UPI00135C9F40|nr:hypothetical protein [Salinirussus salinus]
MTSTSDAGRGTNTGDGEDLVADLAAAEERVEAAEEAVADFGEAELERLAAAHEDFSGLLDRYEEPATGDGDFQQFIEFQEKIADFVDRLDEDLLLYEVFEECDEYLQQRRLTEGDFAHVREQLDPVADLAARLEERDAAREAYRSARTRIRTRRRELADRVADLERLRDLGEADLDAPTERLRDPVEAYNEQVREAFERFRREEPARDVLDTLADLAAIPLVPYEAPPDDLHAYVRDHEAGEEPVGQLLEYADYSRSKLAHYVADPDALKRAVATRRTYLRGVDPGPLTVDWPPPEAGVLRYRCDELTGAVDRVAPDAVAALRAVRRLPRETDYERLRRAAVARAELSPAERERVRSGAVEAELERAREQRTRLGEALETYPSR